MEGTKKVGFYSYKTNILLTFDDYKDYETKLHEKY